MLGIRPFTRKRWNRCIFRIRQTTVPVVVDTGGRLGIFAALTWCMMISNICRAQSRTPYFRLSRRSPYAKGRYDAFVDTLEQKTAPALPALAVRLHAFDDFPTLENNPPLTFESAHEAFGRHFKIPEKLTRLAETQIATIKDTEFLAIHYRGTDKRNEGYYPTPAEFLDTFALQAAVRHPNIRDVFIATDVPEFLDAARTRLSQYRISTNNDQVKANGKTAIHLSEVGRNAPQALAEDALLNCIILSRARFLVKTPSILSGWAKVLNPELDIALLGQLREHARWFPDSLLTETKQNT